MSKPTEFKNKDLRSGYVVEFRNGVRRIVARVNDFTRILVNPTCGDWNYLSWWGDDLKLRNDLKPGSNESWDITVSPGRYEIVKVYGLVTGTENYRGALYISQLISPENRPLLWERKDTVKMTVAEISAKLGYEVEIVAEGCK